MTVAVVQQAATADATRTSVSLTVTATNPGNTLVVFLGQESAASPGTTGVSDNGGNTWTKQAASTVASGRYVEVWTSVGSSSSATSLTLTNSVSQPNGWSFLELSGITTFDAASAAMQASTLTPTAQKVTPTTSTDYVLGYIKWNGNSSSSISTSSPYALLGGTVAQNSAIAWVQSPASGTATGPTFATTGSAAGSGEATIAFQISSITPAQVLSNNAAGGTNGTPVTQGVGGNSGGTSGHYFDAVPVGTGVVTFVNSPLPTLAEIGGSSYDSTVSVTATGSVTNGNPVRQDNYGITVSAASTTLVWGYEAFSDAAMPPPPASLSGFMYQGVTTTASTAQTDWTTTLTTTQLTTYHSFVIQVPSSNPASTLQIKRNLVSGGVFMGSVGINASGKLVVIDATPTTTVAGSSLVAAYGGSFVRIDITFVSAPTGGSISAQVAAVMPTPGWSVGLVQW